ncbi:DUF5344 family protein [Halalkalibacterium halodurans]|jgi:hypothetical protein|nr:DUF5344 family protein [Halalkalibacterium halodurans]MED4195743.1 DUF5344 family protein [Halalkalibacterium halodurans]TPE68221.1 hypothetical protein AMD02_014755 [Halalkalibacterium halodurans]
MEIKVNVAEANALLQSVGELAGSFQAVPVSTSADDLDMMTEVDAVKVELDEYVQAYMAALYQTEVELQSLIQGYETVDHELAGLMK